MSVYIVLEMPDDNEAKEYVKKLMDVSAPEVKANPVAVFKKPTQFCECTSHTKGFTRGRKYGWWVCASCGKTTEKWGQRDTWFGFLGTNLIPIELLNNPEYRPSGWQTPALWSFLLKGRDASEEEKA